MKIELSPELKAALALRHRKIHDGHQRDRIKAVLLRSEDWGIKQIAQALRLHEASISRHIDEFSTLQTCILKMLGYIPQRGHIMSG
jgi:DNA-binding MarR family transcriptional regulator